MLNQSHPFLQSRGHRIHRIRTLQEMVERLTLSLSHSHLSCLPEVWSGLLGFFGLQNYNWRHTNMVCVLWDWLSWTPCQGRVAQQYVNPFYVSPRIESYSTFSKIRPRWSTQWPTRVSWFWRLSSNCTPAVPKRSLTLSIRWTIAPIYTTHSSRHRVDKRQRMC
jgi:hypothetical protein